jgi:zinc protease
MHHILRAAVLPALLAVTIAPTTLAQEAQAPRAPRPWEHESSDLTLHPRLEVGALPNGLRYAWMANPEPDQRCYLRLHVDAGAFAEEDDEDGMAHFLEHMAFNGSEHFAAGTLIEWFQEHGMAFGADLNAMTGWSQTVYHLDLPTADEKTLREGLVVMRDWAGGLLLAAEEVEKEKGVIDAEEASGDTARRRVFERVLAEQYAGTRYVLRDVIGERDVRAAFAAADLRAFYERWYRPERMTIVVVGDLGELDPVPLVADAFLDLAAPDRPLLPEPAVGEPPLEERFFAVHEPEISSVSIHLERLVRWEDEPDTKATRIEDLDLAAARGMLNQRYEELAKKEGAPFLSAGVSDAGGLEVYDGESLTVTSTPQRWEEAFVAAEEELRRALAFGFQQPELDEVRANWLRSLDEAVEREPTRHSRSILGEVLTAAEERTVPTDATTDRALLRPAIEALTVEGCHAAFVEAWDAGVVNLYTTGALDLGPDAAATLRALYERALATEVEAGEAVELAEFAYASSPDDAGTFTSERHVEDLDAWLLELANGVRVNLKATDFKEREILLQARVAEGLLTLPPEDFAVAWVGSQAVNLAGLGAHSVDEVRKLTAGKRVGLGFGIATEHLQIAGATTAEDLLLELELLTAQLADPGWRDDGIRLLRDRLPLMFEQLEHVPSGPLYLEFLPKLFHGDPRFSELPARAAIEAVDMEAIRAWLAPHLAQGPVELTLVGDLDVDAVKAAVARTLGTLPARRAYEPHPERREVQPPARGLRVDRAIETADDKAFVHVVLPIADGRETARRRGLQFLAEVVQDRVRVGIREELGAAYSPGAGASPSEAFPGVGTLSISASLPPRQVEPFVAAALEIVGDVAEHGVTAEEVHRLAQPVLAMIRDARRTNGYWLQALAEAQRDPDSLDDVRTAEAFYGDLDAEELSALAKKNLDPEAASILIVRPAGATSAPTEAGALQGGEGAEPPADGPAKPADGGQSKDGGGKDG